MTEQSSRSPQEEKIIPGKPANAIPSPEKIIPGQERTPNNAAETVVKDASTDLVSLIADSTRKGGLGSVPIDFVQNNGSWTTINSDNPFEVLYLDYRQYKAISDEVVKKNYDLLVDFWAQTLLKMNRGARDQIDRRYTAKTVNEAGNTLKLAFSKLETEEKRKLYFDDINQKRIQAGVASIERWVELFVTKGEITKEDVAYIVREGVSNNLEKDEVESYILTVIKSRGFRERGEHIDSTNPFKNGWMSDEAWAKYEQRSRIKVEWLNEKASTPEQLGEITFQKKEEALKYLKNTNYLPPLITLLTANIFKTEQFQEIIEEEARKEREKNGDPERLYFRILYLLNPKLPFRFDGKSYFNVSELFIDACKSSRSYTRLFTLFSKGYLHIWLREKQPELRSTLPVDTSYHSFLKYLYTINKDFPFYLDTTGYATPEALIQEARKNRHIRNSIFDQMEKGYLSIWFDCLGRAEITAAYRERLAIIKSSGLYTHSDELHFAAVQALILTINKQAAPPKLVANVTEIIKLNIGGDGPVNLPLKISLSGEGFVKSRISLSPTVSGITLNQTALKFDSLADSTENEVAVQFNALHLTKGRVHSFNVVVETGYQSFKIPVQLKIVFPQKAYVLKLVMYSLIWGVYFGNARFLLGLVLGYDGWLATGYPIIGQSPFLSFFFFGFFLFCTWFIYKKTREFENI